MILCRVLYFMESSSAQISSKPLPQAQGDVLSAQATCSSAGKCVGGHGRSPRDIPYKYVWVCVTLTHPYQNARFCELVTSKVLGGPKHPGSERPTSSPIVWHHFGAEPSASG